MDRLLILLEQLDGKPPTIVTQATTWWETVFTLVKLQESGLGMHQPVKVCYQRAISFFSICAKRKTNKIWFLHT